VQYGVDSLGASEGPGATPEPSHFAHRWQYGWLPSSKIKDFKGAFGNIAKSRKSKIFLDAIDEALRLAPDFNPEGWKRPEPRPKKPKPPPSVNKEEDEKRKKDKAKGKKSSKPVTERQQLKALGVRMEGYVTSLQRPRNAAPRVVASLCQRWALP
jgi:hypothetical protein